MRRSLSLIVCLILVLTLLAGCEEAESSPTTPVTRPEVTETIAAAEESLPPEPQVTYPEAQLNTAVLRDQDVALRKRYVLMAVSSDAPFMAKDVELNERGANALAQWLMTEDAMEIVNTFGAEEYGEPLFTPMDDTIPYIGWINESTLLTETIHLAVESSVMESGLMDSLLPAFEESYRYTVKVTGGSTAAVLSTARSGYADLVLVEAGNLSQTMITDGFARIVPGLETEQPSLCSLQYLLCGPLDDPAGIAKCGSVGESFAAIAKGAYTFTSRGDKSPVHLLEKSFWPENTQFGDWYISADTEMGPCLVLNDIEGGYILTDKLTWLIFAGANGII